MRAVVTGAAGGIGRATAFKLNEESMSRDGAPAKLVIADVSEERLNQTAADLRAAGASVEAVVANLADPAACEAVIAKASSAFGGLDALISNAGIIQMAKLLDLTVADFDRCININTRPTWLLAKAAYPMLKESRGSIVAVTSVAAHHPYPSLGAYSMSKAALRMLVRQLAFDWGSVGIRTNSVSPGSTYSNIGESVGRGPMERVERVGNNPLGRMAEPEDQAAVIAFLVSPSARQVNGADFACDGGALTQLLSAVIQGQR